jgi:hypothetical protein
LEALECIIAAESGFDVEQVETIPPIALANKISFGATYFEFHFRHPSRESLVTFRLFYMAIWEKVKLSKLNWFPAMMNSEVFSHQHHTEDVQALYVLNIGLHEDNEKKYSRTLIEFFKFADKELLVLGKNASANKFLYRETSAQHFNKSAGYYNYKSVTGWKSKNPGKNYKCVASASTDNTASDWRHRAEEAALETVKGHPKFDFVPFNAITRHYHDMHTFAFKKTRPNGISFDIDCTHFYSRASVILYRMLWRDLLMH